MYVTAFHSGDRKEVTLMHILLIAFLVSLAAGVAAIYICKWLERNK